MRGVKKFLVLVLVAGILLALLAGLAARSYMLSPIDGVAAELVYEVPQGASLQRVTTDLEEQGMLRWPLVFKAWGRISGKAQRIQAGEYVLQAGATPASLLDQFVAGRVKLYPFTILEGWTFKEVLAAMATNPAIVTTIDPAAPDLQQLLGDTVSGLDNPEGWFFPETYFVPKNTPDLTVLKQANELMASRLGAAWDNRDQSLPLGSPYELLTMASIIERETAVESERRQVAGVFIRRLQKNMRLQTDPTVIYGLGDSFDGNLTRRHLTTDNPYNTYTRGGLPPTPIGMPGEASLFAAGQPDSGDALYFVASGEADGTHVFSATLEEHNTAVAAYIAQLRRANRARASGAN